MADFEAKADEYQRQAQRKSFGWGLLGKTEDAVELYENAANAYKLAKSWDKAGSTYVKLADTQLKLGNSYAAACAYASAGNCYKKTQMREAIKHMKSAVDLFMELGRLTMAARYLKDVGQAEVSSGSMEEAAKSFEQAAELYDGEEQSSQANTCRLKVAHIAAEFKEYQRAIEIFEGVAERSLDNNLLRFGVKGHLMNAGICQICKMDAVAVLNAIQKYQDLDPSFESSRECKFLTAVATAIDESDVAKFTDAVIEYDSLSRLDEWRTTLLLRAKEALKARDEAEEDDLT